MAASTSVEPRAICPWSFLNPTPTLENSYLPLAQTTKPKTFASIVSGSVESTVALSQLPAPVVRGDTTYVKINEALYQEQLKTFKTNLIGRLLLLKGSAPLKLHDLKASRTSLWNPSSPWRLVPLGKGYFDIHFDTESDMRRIWGGGTFTLASGLFCLSQWQPDFKPGDTLPQTHSQIWVRFYGLSQDYWHSQHLMEIARGVGTPLQLDMATKEKAFGYFAKVLVDVDLASNLPSSLMVERENHCFPIEVIYENMCDNCGMVGHIIDHCKCMIKDVNNSHYLNGGVEKKQQTKPVVRQEYSVKPKLQAQHPQTSLTDNEPQPSKEAEIQNFADKVLLKVVDQELDRIADLVLNEPVTTQ
ncbi:uncharacterized protein LOC133713830 [Rosa rugosa]|uniref:uncharacterized protein LOC133713830 n=1 Tax=Rosa rugosa TaxID=74645 RepID=UPI002B408FCC|nr:uncharacterized protein LOC133713830 [Rosa rugosa]